MILRTGSGSIRGADRGGVVAFTGIPYAQPPVGPLRFRAPRPPAPWAGVRDALDFGNFAMQQDPPSAAGTPPMSEDCLVLHVWTPAVDTARRPVMVWLHGGGYGQGRGREDRTDGAVLAHDQDVVVVSMNHRLGPFGFLRLGSIDADRFPDCENVGLLDIVAALVWVRDNIDRFGGDPSNVTVFGWSGGGWKLSALLAMPVARGLFHKGIILSGSELHAMQPADSERTTRYMLERVGVAAHQPELAQDVPAERFLQVLAGRYHEGWMPGRFIPDGTWNWDLAYAPTVDGDALPREPFWPDAPPGSAGIPLLIGTTRDEVAGPGAQTFPSRFFPALPARFQDAVDGAASLGLSPDAAASAIDAVRARRPSASPTDVFNEVLAVSLFFMRAVRQLEAKIAQGTDPVYSYLFATGPAGDDDLAVHGHDLPYVFGNLDGIPDAERAEALSSRMRAAWGAFARSDNPGHPGLPAWPRYELGDRATMVFADECRVENDPGGDLRRILDGGPA